MFRAIWRAIVVLPVPWAPPRRRSSPARRPAPIVLSSGVKPRGTGWYSPTRPETTLSFRSTSTSRAERGAMLPVSASSRQVCPTTVGSAVSVTLARPPGHEVGCIVAPGFPSAAARKRARSDPKVLLRRTRQRRDLVPETDDRPDAGLGVVEVHPLVRGVGVAVRRRESEEDDVCSERLLERQADRDGAALADVDR